MLPLIPPLRVGLHAREQVIYSSRLLAQFLVSAQCIHTPDNGGLDTLQDR